MSKPILPPDMLRDFDSAMRRITALERRMAEMSTEGLIPHSHDLPDHEHALPDHEHDVGDHEHDLPYSYYYLRSQDLFNVGIGVPSGFMGWDIDGFPNPCFSRQANIVTFQGVVAFIYDPDVTYPYNQGNIVRHDLIPFEFRPKGFKRFLGHTGGGGEPHYLWQLYLDTNGSMYMDSRHTGSEGGTPLPWGTLTGDEVYLPISFSITYPIEPTGNYSSDGPQGLVLP